jgi:hypothetical protein
MCANGALLRADLAAQSPSQTVVKSSGLTVSGFVLQSDKKTRVPNHRVQLRDVTTGAVVEATVSDKDGAFLFVAPGPGEYVIEAVDDNGKVRAITNPFPVADTTVKMDVILPHNRVGLILWTSALVGVLAAGAATGVLPFLPGPNVTSPER